MSDSHAQRYERFTTATRGEALPFALVDLDALEANVDALVHALERGDPSGKKTLRVATKSVRCPDLLLRIAMRGGHRVHGLMTYAAAETEMLADRGHRDLLLAYPTAQPADAAALARANAHGAVAAIVVDDARQLAPLADAARAASTRIPVVIDLDVSLRPAPGVHIGVRRSPVRTPEQAVALARAIARSPELRFHGVMAYEAQIAGVPDRSRVVRAMKRVSRADVASRREAIVRALARDGFPCAVVDGGGTGSVARTAAEDAITEVAAGSGFLDPHLFDSYEDLALLPAAYFALQTVRAPAPGIVTCHGGGYVASGAAGRDRLPIPVLPEGLSLLPLEGAGEVQTPLACAAQVPEIGWPVFFRHAKAGELAEHFAEYLLVRGDRIEAKVPTYRGLGRCFLG